ncbi:saccharopine dehydrogenase family protein [Paracoccus xiamenensis]|uniref:saccharopine dehydrogenase family protein n=1 Tax=Paracoccus xiamenensis TaxID=2714901 RepID=UPI001A99BD39|nr:saccharopine dehydrogenase NADP-binding domain-containing protein [Paracoccus xiamenensis]
MQDMMIYGAYGYTGELTAREAVRRGERPILAGRSDAKLKPLAEELDLPFRAFDVTEAASQLDGVKVLLNCAGPFARTAPALIDACIAAGVHYVDITGEIAIFAHCQERDADARAAGVILCPGAGFDIVPTDCLAAELKARLPEAETINLAFSFGTKPSIGTATTAIEAMKDGGMIRRDHKLVPVGNGYRIRRISFPDGRQWAVTLPWGDVYTSGVSTGVPNGMVYAAVPLPMALAMRLTSPFRGLTAKPAIRTRLDRMVKKFFSGGPDDAARATQRTEFWGEAIAPGGKRLALHFSAPNVYSLTVDTCFEIARWCQSQSGHAGFQTPSMLLGADFITSRPEVTAMTEVGAAAA